jgi:hypothetical protein
MAARTQLEGSGTKVMQVERALKAGTLVLNPSTERPTGD